MLLRNNKLTTQHVEDKLMALATWIESAKSPQEMFNREAEFEELLNDINLSSLSKSSIIEIATGESLIRLNERCR